jgi:probable phosphoglycerate mutase
MDLLLIRHGLPVRLDHAEGIPDPELSEEGHRQAKTLAAWLEPAELCAIWSSPLLRAQQTAAPLAADRHVDIQIDPDFEEMDFGLTSYVPYEEALGEDLNDYQRFTAMMRNQRDYPEFLEFRARVVRAIVRVAAAGPDKGLAAVACHGGVINAALASAMETPDTFIFPIDYTSVTHLRVSDSGRLRAMSANEMGHLGSRSYTTAL